MRQRGALGRQCGVQRLGWHGLHGMGTRQRARPPQNISSEETKDHFVILNYIYINLNILTDSFYTRTIEKQYGMKVCPFLSVFHR